jgi:crossover junction endodeoxyribonuclease RuvC
MRVLGIDPGLTRCGIGMVRSIGARNVEFEHVEVLTSSADDPLQQRVHHIGRGVARLLNSADPPAAIAIERVFAQRNLPSVMGVAQISGAVLYLAAERDIPVTFYTPNEVKMQVTGYGAADKSQVTKMVTRLLGLQGPPKPADAADALALALTHAWQLSRGAATQADAPATSHAPGAETPAQRAWKEAERKSGARRGPQRR